MAMFGMPLSITMYVKIATAPSVKWRNFRVSAISFSTEGRFARSAAVSRCGSGICENAITTNATAKIAIAITSAGTAWPTCAFATSPPTSQPRIIGESVAPIELSEQPN